MEKRREKDWVFSLMKIYDDENNKSQIAFWRDFKLIFWDNNKQLIKSNIEIEKKVENTTN